MLIRGVCWSLVLGWLICTGLLNQATAQDQDKQDQEIAWFDMDHCEICKNMASLKDQMHKMKWEMHMLDDGMLMISVVPDEMKKAMTEAEKGVQETVKQLESGKQLDLCGFCQNYGQLMALGAKITELKTVGGDIAIISSTDSEVVKKIQAFGKKAKVEHDKMLKQIKSKTGLNKAPVGG